MTWILRIAIGLVALVLLAVVVGPRLIPTEGLAGLAETEASRSLGREVSIGSISRVSLLPPRLTVQNLAIASGEGFTAENLVTVDEARIAVQFWPLLSGSVAIEAFVLSRPMIALETRADGTNNFTFTAASAGPEASDEAAPATTSAAAPATGRIIVENGTISWHDPDRSYEAEGADLTLVLPPVGEPLRLDGAMEVEGVPFKLSLDVAEPWAMAAGAASDLRFNADLGGNTVGGSFSALPEPLKLRGTLAIALAAPERLAPILGQDLVTSLAPFGAVRIEGTAEASADQASFSDATFRTALAEGSGTFALAFAGETPSLTGRLDAGVVDVRPLMPAGLEEDASDDEAAGFPAWSEEPMDFSALGAANADVTLTAEAVVLPTFRLADIAASVLVKDGRARIVLDGAEAFGGSAEGTVTVDARSPGTRAGINFAFAGVDFADLAAALASTDRLSGTGSLRVDLSARGSSQLAWMRSLGGTTSIDIEDGAIDGIDLSAVTTSGLALVDELRNDAKVLPAVTQQFSTLRTEAVGETARTPFDVADMDVRITDGVASLTDARLLGETFRTRINGSVALAEQRIDLALVLAGKAPGSEAFRELDLPVTVTGTFSEPKFGIDTKPLAAAAARGAAKDLLGDVGIEVDEGETIEKAIREKAGSEIRDFLGALNKKKEKSEDEQKDDPPQD